MPADDNGGHGDDNAIIPKDAVWNAGMSDASVRWARYFLRTNFHVYEEFRAAADAFTVVNADARFGAALILERLRFMSSVRVTGDVFKLNNNARSFLARLYLLERPTAKLEVRKAWMNKLLPSERAEILTAFKDAGGVIAVPDGDAA